MICAIMCLDNLSATFYSYEEDPGTSDAALAILMNDFDDLLPDNVCMAITVNGDGDVVLMERIDEQGSMPLCYNVMKAYCQTYGVGMALPEYVGPYTLEAAKRAHEDCGDYMTIIPAMEEGEVCCES